MLGDWGESQEQDITAEHLIMLSLTHVQDLHISVNIQVAPTAAPQTGKFSRFCVTTVCSSLAHSSNFMVTGISRIFNTSVTPLEVYWFSKGLFLAKMGPYFWMVHCSNQIWFPMRCINTLLYINKFQKSMWSSHPAHCLFDPLNILTDSCVDSRISITTSAWSIWYNTNNLPSVIFHPSIIFYSSFSFKDVGKQSTSRISRTRIFTTITSSTQMCFIHIEAIVIFTIICVNNRYLQKHYEKSYKSYIELKINWLMK